jgi:hypothetical protein
VPSAMARVAERHGSAKVEPRDLKKDIRADCVVRSVKEVPVGREVSVKERSIWKVYVAGSSGVEAGMSWTVWELGDVLVGSGRVMRESDGGRT